MSIEQTTRFETPGSLSRENCSSPEAFERVNYMRSLVAYAGKPI